MTTADGIHPTETTVPMMHCTDADRTIDFLTALGFEKTWEQRRPYLYLAFRWSGIDLHYKFPPDGVDPAKENTGGCLVFVDEVAPYHAAIVAAMRAAYGKVLAKGLPRVTRYRPGASRFTLMDPSGNMIIFVRRDEPMELEYGGSKKLAGLARALDNTRILREFKGDDKQAFRALKSAFARHADAAAAVERGIALGQLVDLTRSIGEDPAPWLALLREAELTEEERAQVRAALTHLDGIAALIP